MRSRTWVSTLAALLGTVAVSGARADGRLQLEIISRALQPGEVIRLVVGCTCRTESTQATATALGQRVSLFPVPGDPDKREGLIGIDLETAPGSYDVSVVVATPGEPALSGARQITVRPKSFPTRRITVARQYADPPAETVARILREAKRLDALYQTATPQAPRGPFVRPVPHGATSSFGARSIVNGEARSPHSGVDFRSPAGSPVAAPAAGTVVLAEDLFFTGNTVVIDHGFGLISILAHLSAMAVAAGDRIEAGDAVGAVGSTGRSTGPHLHWSVRLNGARVNPLSLLAVAGAPPAAPASGL